MAKTTAYHEAAVQYNKEAMEFFAGLSERLQDPIISKWAFGISRQHEFHMKRHEKVLAKKAAEPAETAEAPEEAPQASDTNENEMAEVTA